jgi:mcrBC restriction endonuclease system, mcrB subunit
LANPKEDNENNTEWIIACNPDKYDVIGAFHELGSIDWTQSANIVVGDIVYIYVSNTVRTIKVKCKVNAVNKAVPTIDDSKFNKSDEFDGSKGRYMELEMIEEFSTGLFEKSRLEQHSFKSPLGPVRVSSELKEYLDIVQELLRADEMEPDTHDATYELIREVINSYEIMGDLSVCDYRDLDLVYLMSVGTWRHGFDSKKKTIDASHLPDSEKSRLKNLLDELGERAKRGEYANNKEINANFGMFGTGLYTFGQKTDEHSPKDFIQMCIDIKNLSNDEEIFNRCERTLNEDFHGMRAASASMILHCLKPMTFPIFNSNMGFDNIYVYFNIGIKRKTELCTYIENVRIVKAFRDKYFTVKNYRIFDIAAWEIGKARQHTNIDYLGATDYYPSLNEYNPGITAEEYERILDNENIVKRVWLDTLYYLYIMGGTGSCKQITNKYGNSAAHYNMNTIKVAKAVHKETQCPLCVRESGENEYWPVLFYGRALEDSDEGVFSYKMREPLMEAIKSLEERGVFQEMKELDKEFDKNLILYGPPGTGKTYNSVIYAVAICDGKPVDELTDYAAVMSRYNELKKAGRISFTTFHQSYGYEEFIEGIKPIIDENKQDIGYTIEPGVFKKFCDNAKSITRISTGIESTVIEENTEPYVFIIDEINRGNISKIFGELITLIESTKRAGMPEAASAILPYSGDEFSVPSNVYILGTMNTADRSIALMDTALRRRFQFVEMMPDSDVLRKIHADKVEDLDVAAMLDKINERIEYLYDREHTIGHAFFTDLKDDATLEKLQSIFEKSVIPLLQEYFYEDYQKIQLVLGDNAKSDDSLKFIIDEKVIAKNIFKGNVEDVIDLPEKKYSINSKAFENINSYKEIL